MMKEDSLNIRECSRFFLSFIPDSFLFLFGYIIVILPKHTFAMYGPSDMTKKENNSMLCGDTLYRHNLTLKAKLYCKLKLPALTKRAQPRRHKATYATMHLCGGSAIGGTNKCIGKKQGTILLSYVQQELKQAAWYNPNVRFPQFRRGMTGPELANAIHTYLQRLGDCHASARWREAVSSPLTGVFPWVFERCNQGVVAIRVDTGKLQEVSPLVTISNEPIDRILERVTARIGMYHGSTESYAERNVLRALENWDKLFDTPLVLGFRNGTSVEKCRIGIERKKKCTSAVINQGDTRIIRIRKMRTNTLPFDLEEALQGKFKRLVLDFRNNEGGERDMIRVLASYLSPGPVVGAVARSKQIFGTKNLHGRYMFPQDHFKGEQLRVVKAIPMKRFPRGKGMSELHYFVVGPEKVTKCAKTNVPVSVLMNTHCFSACDIALATLDEISKKYRPDIRLIGTPSSGGSSASHRVELCSGRLRLRYGTMLSWKVNGDTFDGHGTIPHITVLPDPEECEQPPQNGVQMTTALLD